MKIYRIECSMSVPVSLQEAFAFFENPHNLARITPPWLNFCLASPEHTQVRKGARIDYQIRWLGLPLRWTTVIAEYEPPFFFEDEQAAGPYAYWHHLHDFKPIEYGTLVSDRVDYALPFGPLGRLAHRLAVRTQLQEIFDYRQNALAGILTGATEAK